MSDIVNRTEEQEPKKPDYRDKCDIRLRKVSGIEVVYGRYKGERTVCIVVKGDREAAFDRVRKWATKKALEALKYEEDPKT